MLICAHKTTDVWLALVAGGWHWGMGDGDITLYPGLYLKEKNGPTSDYFWPLKKKMPTVGQNI